MLFLNLKFEIISTANKQYNETIKLIKYIEKSLNVIANQSKRNLH